MATKWHHVQKSESDNFPLPFLTINWIGIAVFYRLKAVGCFLEQQAKFDIFTLENRILQRSLSSSEKCRALPPPPPFSKFSTDRSSGRFFRFGGKFELNPPFPPTAENLHFSLMKVCFRPSPGKFSGGVKDRSFGPESFFLRKHTLKNRPLIVNFSLPYIHFVIFY